jgi:hypothetical protein
MDGLAQFVQRLVDGSVPGDLWVDGSFLTEKIDPKDVDVVVAIDGDSVYDHGTPEQRATIDWVIANQNATLKCGRRDRRHIWIGHKRSFCVNDRSRSPLQFLL